MKLIKLFFVPLMVLIFVSASFAQRKGQGPSKEDIEKFKAKKVSFITDKLQLTPAEAQKFWPVYNQLEQETWEAQNRRREIEMKVQEENDNLSDKQIIELTKEMVETYKAEALVSEKYNKKFLDLLPPQKVLKLYKAEHQFRMQMLHEYRNRKPDNDEDKN